MTRDPFDGEPIALSEEERDAVQAWVDRVKPMVGLPGWMIRVSRHRADKDSLATSYVLDNADESSIALPGGLAGIDPDELRASLTHELLHCHLYPLTHMVEALMAGELGKRTEAIFRTAMSQIEERTIDRMARAIAVFLPFVEVPRATEEGSQPEGRVEEHQDAGQGRPTAEAGGGDRNGHAPAEQEEGLTVRPWTVDRTIVAGA